MTGVGKLAHHVWRFLYPRFSGWIYWFPVRGTSFVPMFNISLIADCLIRFRVKFDFRKFASNGYSHLDYNSIIIVTYEIGLAIKDVNILLIHW